MRFSVARDALLAFTLVSLGAHAQSRPGEPLRLPPFEQNLATGSTTESLVSNPANLAFLPAGELRLSSTFLDDAGHETSQGHALSLGFPIPLLRLATALRLDLVDPPSAAARRSFGVNANYQWLTWGLALRSSRAFALGVSLQNSWSSHDAFDGLGSFSLGATWRPANPVALSVAGHDLNGPENDSGLRVHPSYHASIGVRPLGSRALEIGLGGAYVDAPDGYFVPRVELGVALPPFGRLSGDVGVADPTEEAGERRWLAGLKLSVILDGPAGSSEAGVGSLAGSALGPDSEWRAHENVTTTLAMRGYREKPGISMTGYALRIRVEDGPSPRKHVALLRRLWDLAEHEPDLRAVVFQIRAAIGGSLAHLQELRDAVRLLRARGKKVLCELEDAGGATLYFCSAADAIVMAPAGRLRFAGLSARYFYVPELLHKLGVRAEYARIGAHKSAPEMFSHSRSSDVARADHIDLLQQFERHVIGGIAQGRQVNPLELRRRVAEGPFAAGHARELGLVDRVIYTDEVGAEVARLVGGSVPLIDDRAPAVPERFGVSRGVALIYLEGDMVDGRSQNVPLLGLKLMGSYTIAEAIKRARENPRIGAIVLRIETPGGSALAADVIWRQIVLTTPIKPVIVSIGSIGASAGYYVASAGTRVYANPLSITGSIGVFAGKVDASELLRKIGVTLETYKTAPRADADSLFRPLSADEQRELERKVGQFYDTFLARVSAGRRTAGVKLSKADVDAVGQGRVWTGEQARERKLVDELGGLRHALAEARRLAKLPEDAPIQELPEDTGNLVLRMLGLASTEARTSPLPASLTTLARALAPFTVHSYEWPLARMELVEIE